MDISRVVSCDEKLCAYNYQGMCHAPAINVGGSDGGFCDTSVRSRIKCGCEGMGGIVGSCKVFACEFNDYLTCKAESIKVELRNTMPRCGTCKVRELERV
jgi:hypothetical protein